MNTTIKELRSCDVQGFAIRSGIKAGQAEEHPLDELRKMGSSLKDDDGPQPPASIRA